MKAKENKFAKFTLLIGAHKHYTVISKKNNRNLISRQIKHGKMEKNTYLCII